MSASFKPDPAFKAKVEAAASEGLSAFVVILQRGIRLQLSKPGTGRVYRRSAGRKRGRNLRERGFHRASAPGNPPAADTGMLRNSWQTGASGGTTVSRFVGRLKRAFGIGGGTSAIVRKYRSDGRVGITLGSPIRYARIEVGYGRAKARPYIKPTLDQARDLFEPTMARAMAKVMR